MSDKAKIVISGTVIVALLAVIAWAVFGRSGEQSGGGAPAPFATSSADPLDGGGEPSDGGSDDDIVEFGEDEELGGPDAGLDEGAAADLANSSKVAAAAAAVWVDHSVGRSAWSASLQPLVREQAWPSLDLPDPLRIGPTEVTGEPAAVDVSVETADYLVPTDAGELAITLVKEGDAWVVTDIDKHLEAAASAPQDADPWADRPMIGDGDPMLGTTDGVVRPTLKEISTDELDASSALEQTERVRRLLEGDGDQESWVAALAAVSEPTFAVSLPIVDRTIFDDAPTETVEVEYEYALGDEDAPFSRVSALDAEGQVVWTATMIPLASLADPSVVTWQVSAIDYADPAVVDERVAPMSEATRQMLLDGAAASTAPLFAQEIGDTAAELTTALEGTMDDPVKATEAGLPFPELNTRAIGGEWTESRFITPSGSDKAWVSVTNTATTGTLTGELTDTEITRTFYVRVGIRDRVWAVEDAQLEEPAA